MWAQHQTLMTVCLCAAMHAGTPDQLLLMDDQTMEQVDRFELDLTEAVCSMCTVTFAEDPQVYFAVGTAYVLDEEPEPSKVWLCVLMRDLLDGIYSQDQLPYHFFPCINR